MNVRGGILRCRAAALTVFERAHELRRPFHPAASDDGLVWAALTREPRSVRAIGWTVGVGPADDGDVRRTLDSLVRHGYARRTAGREGVPLYARLASGMSNGRLAGRPLIEASRGREEVRRG